MSGSKNSDGVTNGPVGVRCSMGGGGVVEKGEWESVGFQVKLVDISGEVQKGIRDAGLECETVVGISERLLSYGSEIKMSPGQCGSVRWSVVQ